MSEVVSDRTKLVERLVREGLLGPAALARLCGTFRQGKPTHPSTISRSMLQGVKLSDGRVVKLEFVRINGRLMSSRQALIRFIERQQVDDEQPEQDSVPRTPTARRRASDAAVRELEEMGA